MTPLVLLLLSQLVPATGTLNMNMQPVMVQDEGVRQGTVRAITVNCTGAGVTCTQSGSTWTLSVAGGGGGGAPTTATYITQTPDATLTNEQALSLLSTGIVVNATGTGVLTIYTGATCTNQFIRALSASGAATCASVNLSTDVTGLLAVSSINATGTPSSTTYLRGDGAWVTPPGGGGGGGNYASDTLTFIGGSDITKTITAAWATASSVILCNAADEEGSVERLLVTVTSRTSGSFVVRGYVSQGTHTGTLAIHCTGL